jgi:peptidyl-prolyl cis-trans isomerase D
MLKVFRHKGVAKKVLWVVSGIIIISFGFGFGVSRYGESFSLSQTAGKVYGKNISLKEYHRNVQDVKDQAVMMHGANAEKILAAMDVDNETWTRIILLKAAEQGNIKASDMEVIQFISTIPFFQRDGEFDKRLYATMVKNIFKREPRDFEEGLRDQIKVMKLFAPALKNISFADEKIRQEYEQRNQKIQVSYVLITPEAFAKDLAAPEAEVKAFFDAHREDFLQPEAVNATILNLAFDAKATADDKNKVSEKAAALLKKLNAKADIAVAAKEYGATIKHTGLFNMDTPGKDIGTSLDLLEQVFSASTGDILGPFETPAGYQIIRIAEKQPAAIPDFDKIKDKATAAVLKNKAMQIASEKAAAFQKTLAANVKSPADLAGAAKNIGLDVKQTPFFGLGDYVPEVGLSDDFTSAAFKLNKDALLSDVVSTPRGLAILCWNATQPADEKKFAEVKKDFEASLYSEARVHAMNELINSLKEKAKLENYIAKINADQKKAMEKLRVK